MGDDRKRDRQMEARRRDEKGRVMRGEGDIGDAGAAGIAPRGREEQQKWRWQQGNRETTREGGQERALGEDTKIS